MVKRAWCLEEAVDGGSLIFLDAEFVVARDHNFQATKEFLRLFIDEPQSHRSAGGSQLNAAVTSVGASGRQFAVIGITAKITTADIPSRWRFNDLKNRPFNRVGPHFAGFVADADHREHVALSHPRSKRLDESSAFYRQLHFLAFQALKCADDAKIHPHHPCRRVRHPLRGHLASRGARPGPRDLSCRHDGRSESRYWPSTKSTRTKWVCTLDISSQASRTACRPLVRMSLRSG